MQSNCKICHIRGGRHCPADFWFLKRQYLLFSLISQQLSVDVNGLTESLRELVSFWRLWCHWAPVKSWWWRTDWLIGTLALFESCAADFIFSNKAPISFFFHHWDFNWSPPESVSRLSGSLPSKVIQFWWFCILKLVIRIVHFVMFHTHTDCLRVSIEWIWRLSCHNSRPWLADNSSSSNSNEINRLEWAFKLKLCKLAWLEAFCKWGSPKPPFKMTFQKFKFKQWNKIITVSNHLQSLAVHTNRRKFELP